MGVGSLRTGIVAAWIVVFGNGTLFFLARRVLDLPGTWEGPVLRPAIVLSVGLAAGMVVLDGQRTSGARLRPVPVVPFSAAVGLGVWAAVTTWWSLEPEVTLWRGVGYAFLPLVAWVIADLPATQFRRALGAGAGLSVAAGLVPVAAGARWALDGNGDWRGLMTNRNGFAPICALAVIAGVSLVVEGMRGRGGAVIGLGSVGLLGSGGRTAVVALMVSMVAATLFTAMRGAYLERPRRSVGVMAALSTAVGAAGFGVLVYLLWDEPTLVQRRQIWRLLGEHIADAPMVGNGWAAFWRHPQLHDDPLLQRGSAHGSVPELLLGGGVVALVLWLVVVGCAVVGTARRAWRSPDDEAWLWLAVVLFLLTGNVTESFVSWFSYNWIVLIAAALRFGGRGRIRSLGGAALGPVSGAEAGPPESPAIPGTVRGA